VICNKLKESLRKIKAIQNTTEKNDELIKETLEEKIKAPNSLYFMRKVNFLLTSLDEDN
jgi:vancomycin permeability regulator SanA